LGNKKIGRPTLGRKKGLLSTIRGLEKEGGNVLLHFEPLTGAGREEPLGQRLNSSVGPSGCGGPSQTNFWGVFGSERDIHHERKHRDRSLDLLRRESEKESIWKTVHMERLREKGNEMRERLSRGKK